MSILDDLVESQGSRDRFAHFSDKELSYVYLALAASFPDKMHAQGMIDEITVEANRRGEDRARVILA